MKQLKISILMGLTVFSSAALSADVTLFSSFVGKYKIIESSCFYNDDHSDANDYVIDRFSFSIPQSDYVEVITRNKGNDATTTIQYGEWKNDSASWGSGYGNFVKFDNGAGYSEEDTLVSDGVTSLYKTNFSLKHEGNQVIFDQAFSQTPEAFGIRYYNCHHVLELK